MVGPIRKFETIYGLLQPCNIKYTAIPDSIFDIRWPSTIEFGDNIAIFSDTWRNYRYI
jgi:hypothetical protein